MLVLAWLVLALCLLKSDALTAARGGHAQSRQQSLYATSSSSLRFRNVKAADVKPLAVLCAETFEGPFAIYDFLQRQRYEREYEEQLSERLTRLVGGGVKHAMILAEDEGGAIAAFVEVGLLPSPVPISGIAGGEEASRPDVPFLGNVAVAESERRRGVGTKLVRVAEKVAQKWSETAIFVAVDADNAAALGLYTKLGFVKVLDERDNINRRGKRVFLRKEMPAAPSSVLVKSEE